MKGRPRSPVVVTQQKTRVKKSLRALGIRVTAALLLFVFATIFLRGNWLVALFVTGGGIWLWSVLAARRKWHARAAVLHDVDAMDDGQFVAYAAELLKVQGYTVHKATRSADWHADLLLTRGKTHLLCRLHHQAGRVDRKTVVGALAAMHAHGCTRAMVVANQPFTRAARYFARQNDCVLIDREGLANLVLQYRQGHRVLAFPREEAAGIRRRK
jgi:restriction system protein